MYATTNSKKRKTTSGNTTSITTTIDADDNQTKKKEGGSSAIATKWRGKKKSKGTAPDVVTCINTYFCVINVYMALKNCSIVMDLGIPQTKANLYSCMNPHRHVYKAFLSQYLDEDNDNAATFAFPDPVFWTLTGTRHDVAFSEFDFALT